MNFKEKTHLVNVMRLNLNNKEINIYNLSN